MELICDVRTMEDLVREMKYDSSKAPLGRCEGRGEGPMGGGGGAIKVGGSEGGREGWEGVKGEGRGGRE